MTRRSIPRLSLRWLAMLVIALAFGATLASQPGSARERGTPNSPERTLYCNGQLVACTVRGNEECDRRYPTNTASATLCYEGVVRSCNASFGGQSRCHTMERVAPTGTMPIAPRR